MIQHFTATRMVLLCLVIHLTPQVHIQKNGKQAQVMFIYMLRATLLTVARSQKQPKCPPTDDG